jgi:hypothetical protein
MRRPPPEAAKMRSFQAVFGAFGGGKGQGGGSPGDFRCFFWRFYELFLGFPTRGSEAGTGITSCEQVAWAPGSAVAGAFGMPAAHGWLLHAGVAGTKSYVYLCFKKKYLYVCLLLLRKEVTTFQRGYH